MNNSKNNSTTLVFPAVDQVAVEYLNAARYRGEKTVCAASVANDEIAAEWGGLHHLPSIYEDDFLHQFLSLIEAHSIDRLFCPVDSVYNFIKRLIETRALNIYLIGQSPVSHQIDQHRQLMVRARRLLPLVERYADGAPAISLLEVAGMLRRSSLIFGHSNDEKLAALMGVCANAPRGDVIEIGSWMGRSASVLQYLAMRYRMGSLLTIDPWKWVNGIQHESPQLSELSVEEFDFEVVI